jgi:hypothetical protein
VELIGILHKWLDMWHDNKNPQFLTNGKGESGEKERFVQPDRGFDLIHIRHLLTIFLLKTVKPK